MKVLTAAQMREVDRRTIELGIPGIVLMENAGNRVVDFLLERFAPLSEQRVVIVCGKGNNGGDGMVIARQLWTRLRPKALHVVLAGDPAELKGDALANYRMLEVCGCPVAREITPAMRDATLVIDALLGTGLRGPVTGPMLDWVREINSGFPLAKIVAVDIPSGVESDTANTQGETVRADYTVTFTAPKIGQVLPPNCERVGELRVAAIGSPPSLYEDDDSIYLSLVEPAMLAPLFRPRALSSHKGDFGHVLIVAGSRGKTGAAAMSGMAALRAGAGLVTVASAGSAIPVIASHAPELMTEPLPETETGSISRRLFDDGRFEKITAGKTVLAIGPGLGTANETVEAVRRIVETCDLPMVVDADGLNALAGTAFSGRGRVLVLTPHPGEMGRLAGMKTAQVQADRLGVARAFAMERQVTLVLKGHRTVIAFADGRVWINPTGTPALASGGTGDILTGTIAAFLGQFPNDRDRAVAGAVWLHGMAGQLGAAEWGEKSLIATDLLRFYPAAINACV
ncbi:MAG TPA: NAD(P)H-hydrate dehydratase [Bryobacteraceae bacterium]|nr:NAD(P)H-hydrate dehydratase [Bryobacteraceae bacterium]HOL70256.1 NAD(P)H-hydrate dehydratase [Bryobacteraceae bacterium]HOQ44135.1 NAD(P)H-hydrate dehydratase [Bryobacteraceae bacterium]HPU70453.1 NAD(P)H-hydrate dehydratase [Bryobacteraceae bacterium]